MIEGPIKRDTCEELVTVMRKMKSGKAAGPSEVNLETTAASGEVGKGVMMELCQCILGGREMPDEWKTSVLVPIFKGKRDVINCGAYRV